MTGSIPVTNLKWDWSRRELENTKGKCMYSIYAYDDDYRTAPIITVYNNASLVCYICDLHNASLVEKKS